MTKKCKHCGVRVEWVNWMFWPGYCHVTGNGDHLGRYCQLQTAEVDGT